MEGAAGQGVDVQFKSTFIKYDTQKGFTEYYIKIIATPGNINFDIQDRYSSMREFFSSLKKVSNIRNLKGLPKFPSKKFFGNTE